MPDASAPMVGTFTLGDLFASLKRHCWLALGVGLAVAGLAFAATLRLTPLYQATATLAAEPRGQALDFQVDPNSGKIEFSFLNTIRDKLQASQVIATALEESGLIGQQPYTDSSDPVGLADSRLLVQTSKDSLSLQVAFNDESPDRGTTFLAALLDAFHRAQIEAHSLRSSDALSFLARSKQEAEHQLADLRAREQAMRREHDLLDDSPSDNIYAQRLRRLTDQLAVLTRDRAAAKALMDQIASARGTDDPLTALLQLELIARHPVVVEQRELLYSLQDRRVVLDQKYGPKHPRMIEVGEEIAAKTRHLAEAANMAAAGVESRLEELRLQQDGLQEQITLTENRLQDYRTRLVELSALQKEIATTEKILDSLREHLAEQQVLASLDANQITIIDPPSAGVHPINIKKPLFAVAALILGAVAAAIAAVAVELLSRKIRSLDRALDLSRMAVMGRMPEASKLKRVAEDPGLSASEPLAEAFRALRARLRLATRGHDGPRRIAITSACPGDGKSTVAAHLALSLAAAGDKVFLIDGDLRQPRLDKEFGLEHAAGLSDVLEAVPVAPTVIEHCKRLVYLAAGTPPSDPAERLHAPPLKHLLQEIAPRSADWIIVDTPPLGRVSDALVIGEQCDFVLVVIREDHTLRADLRRCVAQLAPLEDKVLGMVYNAQTRQSEADLYAGYGVGGYGAGAGGTRTFGTAGTPRRPGGGTGTISPL